MSNTNIFTVIVTFYANDDFDVLLGMSFYTYKLDDINSFVDDVLSNNYDGKYLIYNISILDYKLCITN